MLTTIFIAFAALSLIVTVRLQFSEYATFMLIEKKALHGAHKALGLAKQGGVLPSPEKIGKLPTPAHYRAMSRIRARLTQPKDIELLATFRNRTKFLKEMTDKDLLREANVLLGRFTDIANAYGDACLSAKHLENQVRIDQRTTALTTEVLAATALLSEELASIIVRQGGLPAERQMDILGRFIGQRYNNGPNQIAS